VATGATTRVAGAIYDHALKFYTDVAAFKRVCALRDVPAVMPCMSAVTEFVNHTSVDDDDQGPPVDTMVPPCIVSLRLETLEERVEREPPSFTDAIAILAGVFTVSCFHVLKKRNKVLAVHGHGPYPMSMEVWLACGQLLRVSRESSRKHCKCGLSRSEVMQPTLGWALLQLYLAAYLLPKEAYW
jgi:hypothetical protein